MDWKELNKRVPYEACKNFKTKAGQFWGSIENAATVKDLKGSLERLKKKVEERENKDIEDIIKKQEDIEKVIKENAEAWIKNFWKKEKSRK